MNHPPVIDEIYEQKTAQASNHLFEIYSALAAAKDPADLALCLYNLSQIQHDLFTLGAEWSHARRRAA